VIVNVRLDVATLKKQAEKAGDLTDYAIARRTGLQQSTISRLLTEETSPSLASLVRFRTAYRISLDDLVPDDAAAVGVPAQARQVSA
jgi:transcriptional regulator with XRE-family HTH domain